MIRYTIIVFILLVKSKVLFAQVADSLRVDNDTTYLNSRFISEITIQAPVDIKSEAKWPGAYSKLNSLQLQLGNAFNVKEQLNKVPGVMMQQGTMSTNRITIRGIGSRTPYESNRIKAYWGEMPLTDGDGSTSIEDIGLNDIHKLEVIKGAASSLYGAGMGGVIMLHAFPSKIFKKGVKLKSELASFQSFSQHAQINYGSPQKGYFSLIGGWVKTDGYRQNSNYKRYNLTGKSHQNIGNSYVNILYNFRYLNGQIPSSLNLIDFKDAPPKAAFSWLNIGGYEEDSRHMFSVGLVSPVNSNFTNSLTLFGKANTLDELRPFNRLKEQRYAYGLRNKLSITASQFKAEAGIEFMRETNRASLFSVEESNLGQNLSKTHTHRYYFNGFGLLEYHPIPTLIGQLALNINQTGYRVKLWSGSINNIKFDYHPVISPRLGVNYQIHKNTHLFASIGHGFSAPSMQETQMPDGSFNKQIKPEEGMNYELGLRYHNTKQTINADITIYHMKMKNLLVTERDAEDQFYGKNAGETTHYGLESLLSYHFFKVPNSKALSISFSYFISSNKFVKFLDDGHNYKNKKLPGIPDTNASIDVLGSVKAFHFTVSHNYVGHQYLNDSNTTLLSSYHKTNAKISYNFKIHNLKANVYLGADNMFDTRYASMVVINAKSFGNRLPRYYYPGLPFNVFGGVEVNF